MEFVGIRIIGDEESAVARAAVEPDDAILPGNGTPTEVHCFVEAA